jgi:formylglycine-generating enzyme required for sulfatase activity
MVMPFQRSPAAARHVAFVAAIVLTCACRKQEQPAPSTDPAESGSTAPTGAPPSPPVNKQQMVSIPEGSFVLGCDPARDPQCSEDERPSIPSHLGAFEINRTEVTQAAYRRCVDANRCAPPGAGFTPARTPRHAVTNVTWSEARAYCAFRGARLPTEAEWEKAARGPRGRTFPWGDTPPTCAIADYARCRRPRSPVASFPEGASPYGVLDMAGGVDEWVADIYVPDRSKPTTSRQGQRVARGGAHDPWHIRSTARSALAPGYHSDDLGFRCAR